LLEALIKFHPREYQNTFETAEHPWEVIALPSKDLNSSFNTPEGVVEH